MAVKWIGASWRSDLQTNGTPQDRIYIDFRQMHYPSYGSDMTYTAIASTANQPGSHNLTGGSGEYFIGLTDTITVACRIKPDFAYDTGDDQPVWSWYNDATHYLTLFYDSGNDKFTLKWKDGTNERVVEGSQLGDGEVEDVWFDIAVCLDLTTGDTTGVSLNIDQSEVDTAWDDAADTISSSFPLFELRAENGTEGDYTINYVRMFLSKECTAAQVANDFKDVLEEEIYFPLNGFDLARTRCNVTSHVMAASTKRTAFNPQDGQASANKLTVILNSDSGEFADDQYAAFDAANSVYNGTAAQAYMQQRTPVMLETWYGNDYESVFIGRTSPDGYTRMTPLGEKSAVTIDCDDQMADIAFKYPRKGHKYESKKISDATETNSLIHLITRLATQEDVYNYLANSSFENATIANSWTVAGAGATFTKQAGGLLGGNQGDLVYDAATCNVSQTVTFNGSDEDDFLSLNVGETYTFQIWLKSAGNCSYNLRLAENDSGGENDNTEAVWTCVANEGWTFHSVTHTITDSDSDRLVCYVYLDDNVTLSLDCAMLIKYDRPLYWFVLNDNDGASGVESAGDADNDTYDTCGFDCDAINITHTWQHIDPGDSIIAHIKDLGLATVADYCGFDSAGTFKLRSYFKTGYADPTPILTISSAQNISAIQEVDRANKIIVRGVKILKGTHHCKVWDGEKMGLTAFHGSGDRIEVTLNDGDEWPDPTVYGEPFMARYDF